jgi:hypothetical protein
MPEKVAKERAYPVGGEAKGAQGKFEDKIPVEIIKLLYRQMLLWMGMLVSPFIFFLGMITTFLLYWIQWGTVVNLYKPPKKISEHFAAKDSQRDFFIFFFAANLLGFVPMILFSLLPVNFTCGPLRSQACATEFHMGNLTTCMGERTDGRKNFQHLVDALLPATVPEMASDLLASIGNATAAPSGSAADCGGDGACWLKHILAVVISTQFLVPIAILFSVFIVFTSAAWARNASELRDARRELFLEYQEKKKMARYAGIAL